MKLTSKSRAQIPSEKFALPAERKYPVENAAHARNALARAAQQEKAGNISASTKEKIDAAAHRKLHWSGK